MKKLILAIIVATLAIAANSQTVYNLSDSTITVETKHRFVTEKLFKEKSGMFYKLNVFADNEKIDNDTILFFQPLKTFYNEVLASYNKYTLALLATDTTEWIEYPSVYTMQGSGNLQGTVFKIDYFLNGDTLALGLIQQYDAEQLKIDKIMADSDISYKDGNKKIEAIKTKKAKLLNIYQRIKSQ